MSDLAGRRTRADDRERIARAHLSRVVEPGDAALGPLLDRLGAVSLAEHVAAGPVPDRWAVRARSLDIPTAAVVATAGRQGIRPVVPGDPEWPAGLADLAHARLGAVACLWVRGRLPVVPDEDGPAVGVAVVGARDASPYGESVAGHLGADLADAGWTVVSGAALGIDAAAHRGALARAQPAEDGPTGQRSTAVPTVAVLGCGVDRPYPSSHAGLLERIVAAGGAVVAELPPGSSPYPWRFPARNRVIAAMSRGVVVVEAGQRSGAVGTARSAHELSRVVMAVPGLVHSPRSAGCHELLRTGADLVTGARDVLDLVGPIGPGLEGSPPATAPGDDPVDDRVLRCLSATRERTVDEVAARAGLDVPEVRGSLLDLEATGHARRTVSGWRRAGQPSR